MKSPFLALLFYVSTLTFGQIQKIDTTNIYKNKTKGFKVYKREWFTPKAGTYNGLSKINKQDSLVLEDESPRYFKIYDAKKRLLFEGSRKKGSEMEGDIKFYYKNGKLKRIEHWDNKDYMDSCGNGIRINDAPGPEGTWQFFRKNGSIKKQYDYIVKIYSFPSFDYNVIKQITKFRRNGIKKSVKQKPYSRKFRDK
jgi:hypothetical protein